MPRKQLLFPKAARDLESVASSSVWAINPTIMIIPSGTILIGAITTFFFPSMNFFVCCEDDSPLTFSEDYPCETKVIKHKGKGQKPTEIDARRMHACRASFRN
ncbi:hypothetical protein PoB_001740500 [Plakobranchus ocellatus]|uniref:Uncharacterized protein n=1 Tax=Plakobranchus ocellatus TaxID=259542 RepID=A0AAV3Z6Z0_9GAST|nr:hypothetical protein PoB_001740500 [Plakobranchus ocellatus]